MLPCRGQLRYLQSSVFAPSFGFGQPFGVSDRRSIVLIQRTSELSSIKGQEGVLREVNWTTLQKEQKKGLPPRSVLGAPKDELIFVVYSGQARNFLPRRDMIRHTEDEEEKKRIDTGKQKPAERHPLTH